jgi:hypothetical protein
MRVERKLERSFLLGKHGEFSALAARLNLGVLLIGGGFSLAILAIGPFCAILLGLHGPSMQGVLLWLVLGAASQVFFGATDMLLKTAGMAGLMALLCTASTAFFVVAVLASPSPDAVFLAQCFAAMHLIRYAIASVILVRKFSVWPGLTALFLRQIKLF